MKKADAKKVDATDVSEPVITSDEKKTTKLMMVRISMTLKVILI